jgi:hypothetical protein
MTGAGADANRALGLVPVAYDLRGVTDASTWPICRVGSQHVEWFVAPDIIRPERRTPQGSRPLPVTGMNERGVRR